MLSLLSLLLPAHAQTTSHYWKVTYTYNGTYKYAQRDVPVYGQSTPKQTLWKDGGTSGSAASSDINGDSEGTITATLTWVPTTGQSNTTDPPPSPVSIIEYGYAWEDTAWNTSLGPDPGPSGTADDGWGDAPVRDGLGFHSSGYHVLPPQDGSSGTITVTSGPIQAINPVSAMTPYPAYPSHSDWNWTGVHSKVSFSVYPVVITLQDTIVVNGIQQALTGQPVTASLTINNGVDIGATLSHYQWDIESAEGGSIVGGYLASQALGQTQPVTPLTNPTVTIYDGIQDTVTINGHATITFSDGTTGPLSTTTNVGFAKPLLTNYNFHISESDNFAQHPNDTTSGMGANEGWANVSVTMPAGFSGGTCCFAQRIDSTDRTDTRHTGGVYTQKEQISNGTWAAIPTPCLDTNFAYPFAAPWYVGSTGSGGDLPYFPVAPALVPGDPGRNDWYQSTGGDQFMTWIMYNPSVQTSTDIWVPLDSFNWNWSNMAALNAGLPPAWEVNAFVGFAGVPEPSGVWPTWNTYALSGGAAMRP